MGPFFDKITLLSFLVLTGCNCCASTTIQIILRAGWDWWNQSWTISVSIQNDRFKSHDYVFRKSQVSQAWHIIAIANQLLTDRFHLRSVTMTHLPTKQGTVTVQPLKWPLTDKTNFARKKVKVGPPVQTQIRDPFANPRSERFLGPQQYRVCGYQRRCLPGNHNKQIGPFTWAKVLLHHCRFS